MADELSIALNFKFTPDSTSQPNQSAVAPTTLTKTVTISGAYHSSWVQTVSTSGDLLDIPNDVTTLGVIIIKNLDSANYIEVGTNTPAYLIQINAGEFGLFRVSDSAPKVRANTAAVDIQCWAFDD